MALRLGSPSGTVVPKTTFQGTTATATVPTSSYTVSQDVWEDFDHPGGTATASRGSRLKFRAGQVITAAEYNSVYTSLAAVTINTITPTALLLAGGAVVTITGTNMPDVTSVTFGGVVGTALTIVDDLTLRVTSPATTAGAKDVVLVNPGGNVTKVGAVTYA